MSVTSFLLALGDKIHCSAPMCGALGDLCVDRTICAKGDLRTMAREACALGTQHQFMVAMRHLDRKWLIDWWYAHLRRKRHKYDTHTANDIVRKVCLYYQNNHILHDRSKGASCTESMVMKYRPAPVGNRHSSVSAKNTTHGVCCI